MKKIIVILMTMLIFSGCSSQKTDKSSQTTSIATTTLNNSCEVLLEPLESHIQRTLGDNTAIDADVKIPAMLEIPIIDVELVSFASENVIKAFFDDTTTFEEVVSGGQQLIKSQSKNSSCNFYTNDINSGLFFQTDEVEYIFNVFQWQSEDYNNISLFLNEKEFDFASRDEAINEVKNAIETLGIENNGDASIYALDHQTLASEEKRMQDSGGYDEYTFKEEWSEEDDCYFIKMDCVFNDISVCSQDTLSLYEELTSSGSQIVAVYSQNGFEYFQVMNFYSQKEMGNASPIVSIEDAIATMSNKFESIITTSQYTITDIEFKYIPQFKDKSHSSLELVPIWYFTVNEVYISDKDNSTYEVIHHYSVDAFTGKEM